MKIEKTLRTALGTMAFASALLSAGLANATTYGFTQITANGNALVASQLSVDVTGLGGTASFTFHNVGSIASSITDIYFDDGTLLGISTITDSGADVAYNHPAVPSDLPGGNLASPAFTVTQNFSADSDNPPVANGVNASLSDSEFVTINFNLINGKTISDTLAALADGSLRIGLHVQGIGELGSESFINSPRPGDSVLPDGGSTIALLGFVLIGVDALRRKISRA
jgi:hypothetical protein